MSYTEVKIIEKAVSLSNMYGCLENIEGLSGQVCVTKLDDIGIVYSSPFSGAEVFPGVKCYMVSIWKSNKKIFNCDYKRLADLDGVSPTNKKWVKDFMQLI